MNNQTRMKALLALAVSMSPALSHAITEKEAIGVCAQSLVEKLAEEQGAPLKHSIGPNSSNSNLKVREEMLFNLYGVDPTTDQVVVRANCIVNRAGRVQKLTTLPLYASN